MKRPALAIGFAVMAGVSFVTATAAHAQDTSELAKAAQNPVADMISLPLQNNTFFGIKMPMIRPTCSTCSRSSPRTSVRIGLSSAGS